VDRKNETEEIAGFASAEERAEDVAYLAANGSSGLLKEARYQESTAIYVEDRTLTSAGRCRFVEDTIAFNPDLMPETARGRAAVRWHEVMHRADYKKYCSWENEDFLKEIDNAKKLLKPMNGRNPPFFDMVLKAANVGIRDGVTYEVNIPTMEGIEAIHDILSALREGKNEGLLSYHDEAYWQEWDGLTPIEIFAEIGVLDLMDRSGLRVIETYFNGLFNAYRRIVE